MCSIRPHTAIVFTSFHYFIFDIIIIVVVVCVFVERRVYYYMYNIIQYTAVTGLRYIYRRKAAARYIFYLPAAYPYGVCYAVYIYTI